MSETTEIVTIEDAKARFPDEWVLLEDPEVDGLGVPIRGRLAFHSADRTEVHRRGGESPSFDIALFYTGKLSGRYVL